MRPRPRFVALRAAAAILPLVLLVAPARVARADEPSSGFQLGSYGRVHAATDLRGGTPEPVAVVAHHPRIVESSYVELELRHRFATASGTVVRTVITPAFLSEPFHYTGAARDAQPLLRQLFAEVALGRLTVWAGARMWRGDDVYLLDYWPLDHLNLVGGGAAWSDGPLELELAFGANRLVDPYQHQRIEVVDPTFGSASVVRLDRQRGVAGAKASYRLPDVGALGARASIYLEGQTIGAGYRERPDGSDEHLPADVGLVAGAQLAAWGFGRPGSASHASLFVRHARGLAATDWLAVPAAFGADRRTWGSAWDVVVGTSTNVELCPGGVLVGAYVRRFDGGAPDPGTDPASGWEAVVDARPVVPIHGPLAAAVDLSWQERRPNGVSPALLRPVAPTILQVAPMLLLTPGGEGSYVRPQLRLVYRAAHLDDDARAAYPPAGARGAHAWVHYLGVQAEWWLSSSYPGGQP